jgi:hypothetical protein
MTLDEKHEPRLLTGICRRTAPVLRCILGVKADSHTDY